VGTYNPTETERPWLIALYRAYRLDESDDYTGREFLGEAEPTRKGAHPQWAELICPPITLATVERIKTLEAQQIEDALKTGPFNSGEIAAGLVNASCRLLYSLPDMFIYKPAEDPKPGTDWYEEPTNPEKSSGDAMKKVFEGNEATMRLIMRDCHFDSVAAPVSLFNQAFRMLKHFRSEGRFEDGSTVEHISMRDIAPGAPGAIGPVYVKINRDMLALIR
jgi:hypothetical protein